MTVTQAAFLACTPDAVHGWLSTHDPEGLRRFDDEFRTALQAAATTYDLAPIERLVRLWWASIWGRTQQVSAEEVDQFRRLDVEGDTAGLNRHDIHR